MPRFLSLPRPTAFTAKAFAFVTVAVAGIVAGALLSRGPPPLTAAAQPAIIPFFGTCPYGGGRNCVVDGNTFYFGRDKVRIAGIAVPETHPPGCAAEAKAGAAATVGLRDLLNSGDISLASAGRDDDGSGRKLRHVRVKGADVGALLVDAGLARPDTADRRGWC